MPATPALPPGPPFAPLHTLLTMVDMKRFFQACAERYGDPFLVRLVVGDVVVTGKPEGLREIFTAEPATFVPLSVAPLQPIAGDHSMLLLGGERHRQHRKLLMPPFHGERMRAYGALLQEIAHRSVAELSRGNPLTALHLSQMISLEVIIRAVFGVQQPERVRLFKEATREFLDSYTAPLTFMPPLRRPLGGVGPWDRFQRQATRYEAMLEEEITARRASRAEGQDILSLMLATRDEDGQPMSEAELKDELRTLLLAGYETTAIGMAWALYYIHRLPEVRTRLLDELAALGPAPTAEQLVQQPYLSAVCDEALRIHPVLPATSRKLVAPFTLRGWSLPAGVGVMASILLAHGDPALYPEPERFRPERFLERKYSPFEYLPFGGGARRCLGAAFALYEMKIALGSLLAAHRFTLAEDRPVPPTRRNVAFGPRGGVRLIYQGTVAVTKAVA